jgi:hypothetical protein
MCLIVGSMPNGRALAEANRNNHHPLLLNLSFNRRCIFDLEFTSPIMISNTSLQPGSNTRMPRKRCATPESDEQRDRKKLKRTPSHTQKITSNRPIQHTRSRASAPAQLGTVTGAYCKNDDRAKRQHTATTLTNQVSAVQDSGSTYIPLTREALHCLDNINASPLGPPYSDMASQSFEDLASDASSGTINAYHSRFEPELNLRGIYFADDDGKYPSNINDVKSAVFAARGSPDPDEVDAKNFRKRIRKAPNESATVQSILPKIVPLEALMDSDTDSTAPEQLWNRRALLRPDLKPALTTPKPDRTIGWAPEVFPYPNTARALKDYAFPVAQNAKLIWPLFTVEVKGDGGNLKVAKLQNLHNGAVMLSNLFQLRQASGNEKDFFGKVHVMSVELTTESVNLSCYWAIQLGTTEINYYGLSLGCWSPNDPTGKSYREARRCTRNALDWVKSQGYSWIDSDMKSLEESLKSEQLSQITPPQSQPDTADVRKRRFRKLSSDNLLHSRSSSSQRRKPNATTDIS